jgi:glyoxylate reductase
MPARTKVIVTRKLPDAVEARLSELFDVELAGTDKPFTNAQLADAVSRADVLVPTLGDQINANVLARAGDNLRLIANFGAGVDHIDVETARRRGILVSNTPGVLTEDTADMTMALILAVPRRLIEGVHLIESGKWTGWAPTAMLGHRVAGKRLGIIGMGRIGQAVAKRAAAFGLEIHYHDRKRLHTSIEEQTNARHWESLDQMLARMDVVSVHCPHTPGTFHLLSARRLKLMKPTAYIVNTARGEIIDENALGRMLEAGELGGAGLDVFEHGPDIPARLKDAPNVVLMPHMSSATHESRLETGEKVIINIKTFADGHTPPDRVVPAML